MDPRLSLQSNIVWIITVREATGIKTWRARKNLNFWRAITHCALELLCIFRRQRRFHMYVLQSTVTGDASATRVQGSASGLWRCQPTSGRPQEAKSAPTRRQALRSALFLSLPPVMHSTAQRSFLGVGTHIASVIPALALACSATAVSLSCRHASP